MAYQLAFDLEENATQEFLQKVSSLLPTASPYAVASSSQDEGTRDDAMDTDETVSL